MFLKRRGYLSVVVEYIYMVRKEVMGVGGGGRSYVKDAKIKNKKFVNICFHKWIMMAKHGR